MTRERGGGGGRRELSVGEEGGFDDSYGILGGDGVVP